MQTDELRLCLESMDQARKLLIDWDVHDVERGKSNLGQIANVLGLDGLSELCHPLSRLLPRCADPDMALNNLERCSTSTGGEAMPMLMEARARSLETMLQLFSTSQFFSDLLITNPDFLEMLRIPLRSSPSRVEMLEQLRGEVETAYEDSNVLRASAVFGKSRCSASARTTLSATGPRGNHPRHFAASPILRWRSLWKPRNATSASVSANRSPKRTSRALRHSWLRQTGGQGAELFQRHRPDVPL